jgi:hypothetical protein
VCFSARDGQNRYPRRSRDEIEIHRALKYAAKLKRRYAAEELQGKNIGSSFSQNFLLEKQGVENPPRKGLFSQNLFSAPALRARRLGGERAVRRRPLRFKQTVSSPSLY